MRPYPPLCRTSVLAALLLSCLPAFCASVKVGKSGQDLYAKENDEGTKVATLPSGTVLEKIGEGSSGWIKVKAPTVDCWIFSDTVSGNRVTSSRGRVRTEPNPTSYEITILPRGAQIEPRGKQGEWTKIAPPPNVAFWVKPESVKATTESPTRAPAVKPAAPMVVPPPEPPKVEPPKAEPPKPVVVPQPEPVAAEPPKPVVAEPPKPVAVEPPKPVFPAIPEPVKPEPEYADPAELHAKWEPPKETAPVKPVPQPVVSPVPVEVVRTPTAKPVPTPPPKPAAPPVRYNPPPVVAPAPASGPTITWNGNSSRTTAPATRTANPSVVHPRPHSAGLVAAPQEPVSTSGWETPAATPATVATAAPAPAVRSTGSGATSLPWRKCATEWEDPTPGTLLARKKRSNKNLRSAPPAGISPERLRPDVFQGDVGHATGVLFRGSGGWGRMKPSEFELRTVHEDGSSELVAYVHGSDATLSPYLNRTVRVEGTCWWLGDSDALLVPTVPIQTVY